jgi:hypothetical protein
MHLVSSGAAREHPADAAKPAGPRHARNPGTYVATDMFEVICPGCGDDRGLDYSEVTTGLQWLRGPRTLETGLAEYQRHLGLFT